MYSLKYTKNTREIEKKTAKGITRNVTENVLSHQDYKDCKLSKIGLSPYDDKRYILGDGMHTLARGHNAITE